MDTSPTVDDIDATTNTLPIDDSVDSPPRTQRAHSNVVVRLVATAVAVLIALTATANTAAASQEYKYLGTGWTFEVKTTNCNTYQRRLETSINLAAPPNWEVAILQNVYQKKSGRWTKVSSNQADWLLYRTNHLGRLSKKVFYNNRSAGYDYHVNLNVSIRQGPGHAWINSDDAVYALTYQQNGYSVAHPWACRI